MSLCSFRPFGTSAQDLSVAFAQARRPELVTALLQLCGRGADGASPDAAALRRMTIGARIEALVGLVARTSPAALAWRVRCDDCAEDSDFELDAARIVSFGDALRDVPTLAVTLAGHPATLRRPTADDQAGWTAPSGEASVEAMLRSLLVSPSLEGLLATGADVAAIAADLDTAMAQFDPLPALRLSVVCPRCGRGTQASPDIAGAALDRLARIQRDCIEDVHRLASRYHWSEQQILDLPAWRRERYLEFIAAETH